MRRCKKLNNSEISELPDCVISYIFSKLALKDLVKTSALSKRWIHEWGLKTDLNFDLNTMFDYNTIQDLPENLPLFQRFHFQSQFVSRLDQFLIHYQGAIIRSIRVKFPLGNQHSDLIDRLISKGIAKGVKRIELIFSIETDYTNDFDFLFLMRPYKFSLSLLSVTYSLTYLHLQRCQMVAPIDFSRLKNLTTIVLDELFQNLSDHILPHLFSECLQLEDVTLRHCKMTRSLKITAPQLRHLNIINCGWDNGLPRRIGFVALNLSSFEYIGDTSMVSVKAPRLLKVFWNAAVREKTPHPFGPIQKLLQIENLAMIINSSQIEKVTKELVQFQNLRQLELFIEGVYDSNIDYFWILDIAMASQHLQKLSVTIRNLHLEHSHRVGFKTQKREYVGFSHNDLKYVKFCGCVCLINVIELARHLLKNANSLKKMIFSSCDKFYEGVGRWSSGSGCSCWFDHNVIHEMLEDEVNEQCQFIIL